MQKEVMFAGFGGQGILLSGKLFALAVMDSGMQVIWIPSYGPEMRGGTAYCTVVMADRPIGSPIIPCPSHLVAMNRPSLEKFASVVKPQGVCLVNSSLIPIGAERPDLDELRVPCNDIALKLGNAKCATIVALGAFCARSKLVDFELVRKAVSYNFAKSQKLVDLNNAALDAGAAAAAV